MLSSEFYKTVSTDKELLAYIKSSDVCVVDFFGTWCKPCKLLAPELIDKTIKDKTLKTLVYSHSKKDVLQMKESVVFLKVDIDEFDNIDEYNIIHVPHINIYKNGEFKTTVEGNKVDNVIAEIKKLIS